MGVVQVTDLGVHLQTDAPVAEHDGGEPKLHAILLPLNGDRRSTTGARLRDRIGNLTTGKEGRLLPAGGNQVGLGERAEEVVAFESFDEVSESDTGELAGAEHARRAQSSRGDQEQIRRRSAAGLNADGGGPE